MSLYDSVLDYERKQLKSSFAKMTEKSLSFALGVNHVGDSLFESTFAQAKTMTDFAYKLKDTKLTEEQLDYIVKEVKKTDHPLSILLPSNSKIESAKRNYIKTFVDFYQQVFSQEGNVDTFEEAVRNRFGNAKNYRKALKTVVKVEKKYNKLMATVNPAMKLSGTDKSVAETLDEILKESVNEIFGT